MRTLVTGANGHIGAHVVRAVVDRGWTPVAFVRPGSDRRGLTGLDVELREGDLLDAASVARAMSGIETVLHVGAVHRNFAADPSTIVRPAVEGTRNVLAAARASSVGRVVLTSTGATIGFTQSLQVPLDEQTTIAAPKAAYIRGKLESEALALAAAAAGQDVVVLNPSGVFGPRDYRLTPATRGILGILKGDPAFFGVCLTDVSDVGRAHVLAAERGRRGERYLVVGEGLTPKALSALFAEVTGVRPPTFRPPAFLLRFLAGRMEKAALAAGTDAPVTRDMIADVGKGHLLYDGKKGALELGMTYRPAKKVLRDTVRWLLFMDALPPKVAATVRATLGTDAAPDLDWTR